MKRIQLSQTAIIIIGMALGLLIGGLSSHVIFGVDGLANAFLLLLQMTALPYITLSLIVGIGGLSVEEAKQSLMRSLSIIFVLSGVVLFFILLAPIAFPSWENAGFYSANTVKTSAEIEIVSLFIPSNPFSAYANAVIPSVVVFSIFIGIGLMSIPQKAKTLELLESLQQSVANVSSLVMNFAPIGVFCIAYRAAATIDSSDLNGLVVYVVTSAALVGFLSFAVLPGLVAIFTPFSYRQIIKVSRQALVTAFATGSFFVVIPLIAEKTKTLISSLKHDDHELESIPDIVVPITFSLPVGGKMLALLFTLFAAWFSGAYISLSDYVSLIVVGIPQLFGTSTLAMPHLLDLFNVSSSMFDFFLLAENLIVGRLGSVLSVAFATSLPLMIAAGTINKIGINWKKFSKNLVILPVIAVVLFLGVRFTLNEISYQYKGYEVFIDRDFLFKEVESTYDEIPKDFVHYGETKGDVLTRIQERGFIRVGYFRDDLPYSFHNKEGKLVGFDIEIMNQLASDLGVSIQFIRTFHSQAAPLLASGYLDITSGIPVIPDNMKEFTLTIPYSKQEVAFLVKDERRAEFTQWKQIVSREDLIVGIPETFFYQDAVEHNFTKGKAWEISTPRLFFREEFQHIDGMLFGAAAASAWTLLYPEYTVVVPKPAIAPLTMAFPISKNDQPFELFMRNWINMKQQSHLLDQLFSYWIEGKKVNGILRSMKMEKKLNADE